MRANSQKIIQELIKMWPNLVYNFPNPSSIFLADGEYYLPKFKEVKKLVKKSPVSRMIYNLEWMDCDDYSLLLHAYIVKKRYKRINKKRISKDKWFPWAFGQVWGSKFEGRKEWHAINICITSDKGIVLIEPQSKKPYVWQAKQKSDVVHFVRM